MDGLVMNVLEGLRIVEGSAFVAAPLGGMTLAQLGEFNRCKRFKLRHHAMSALALQTCVGQAGTSQAAAVPFERPATR